MYSWIKFSRFIYLILALFCAQNLCAKSLGVFLPHVYSVKELESLLRSDNALKDYDITVFARMKDLIASHKNSNFGALLVPATAKKDMTPEMLPLYNFYRNGKAKFHLKIIKLAKGNNQEKNSIAAIDELGDRKKSKAIIKKRISNSINRIKLVKKGMDLYPMLNLNNVNHILIDEHDMKNIMKESEVEFKVVTTLEDESPVFLVTKGQEKTYKDLTKISKATTAFFGYDNVGPQDEN